MNIKLIWNKIINNGVDVDLNYFEIKRIRIINAFSFFSTLFALLFTIVLFVFVSFELAFIDFIAAAFIALPFYLNYKKKYKIAAIICFVFVPLIILLMCFIYGKIGNEYYYFPAIILIFYYYKKRQYLFFFSFYYILLFTFIKYFEATINPYVEASDFISNFYFVSIAIALVMTIVFLSLFTVEYEKYQTEIEEKNKSLNHSVKEANEKNDTISSLLKELNHRVKNNLQLVSSILNLQLSSLKDPEAIKALEESKNRIISMALLHRMLYKNGNEMKINMPEYIKELTDYLKDSILTTSSQDQIIIEVDDFSLPLETSVSIGLILNELITNSIKHGSVNAEAGKITVKAKLYPNNKLLLEVKDNGKTFPKNFSLEKHANFGLELVSSLVDQFKGTLEIENRKEKSVNVSLNI